MSATITALRLIYNTALGQHPRKALAARPERVRAGLHSRADTRRPGGVCRVGQFAGRKYVIDADCEADAWMEESLHYYWASTGGLELVPTCQARAEARHD